MKSALSCSRSSAGFGGVGPEARGPADGPVDQFTKARRIEEVRAVERPGETRDHFDSYGQLRELGANVTDDLVDGDLAVKALGHLHGQDRQHDRLANADGVEEHEVVRLVRLGRQTRAKSRSID